MYMNTDDYIIVPPNGRYVDAEHPKEDLFNQAKEPRPQGDTRRTSRQKLLYSSTP